MTHYSEINTVWDKSIKDWRTMKSTRLAVFAASLQRTDELKNLARGIWWFGACRRERRRKAVKHEHLLGLIGRSHFPAQAQAEESQGRRRLDFDRGNTIFTSSVKRKVESPTAAGRSFIYNKKNNGSITKPWVVPEREFFICSQLGIF